MDWTQTHTMIDSFSYLCIQCVVIHYGRIIIIPSCRQCTGFTTIGRSSVSPSNDCLIGLSNVIPTRC